MTDVRTFRAATMQAALEIVRREMGADAVILHTRQIPVKRLLPWGKPKEEVEITAGLGVNVRPIGARLRDDVGQDSGNRVPRERRPAKTETPAESRAATKRPAAVADAASVGASDRSVRASTATISQAAPPKPRSWNDRIERRRSEPEETSELQLAPPGKHEGVEIAISAGALNRSKREARTAPPVADAVSVGTRPRPERTPAATATKAVESPRAERNIARRTQSPVPARPERRRPAASPDRTPPREPRPPRVATNDPSQAFAERLDSIERLLEQLGRRVQSVGGEEIPSEVFELYTELIDRNVEDGLARRMAIRLKEHCTPEQLADPEACRSVLTAMIESDLRCALPITPVRGRRTVVALVGATGVGKTTTIAKLAANFRLRDGIRMGLVTVDTYRIAAVEQLRTYADIIDLPMRVVTNPAEMRRALDEMTGLDLVLIDTAGRSPRDEVQIQELRQLLAEADVDQVHLVLSMTASSQSLAQSIEKFSPVRISSVILTKLDEATGLGPILSLAQKYQTPVSYLTTGQDVPDDLEPASPARLARLILGSEEVRAIEDEWDDEIQHGGK